MRLAVTCHPTGTGRWRDWARLPPLGPSAEEFVGEGVELGLVATETDALALAERVTGAQSDRWVNFGVAGEEYADQVRVRRDKQWPPGTSTLRL
jgi:hypothetical protein